MDLQCIDIREYGANGDGITLNTQAIQAAIDTAADRGGGTVLIPAGRYLTGGLTLRSNVTLHVDSAGTLLGSPDLADYPAHDGPPAEGDANQRHLLFGRAAENVAITGFGTIDGNGQAFWESRRRTAVPPGDHWRDVVAWDLKPLGDNARPSPMIELVECRNVRIEGVTLRNSPGWTLRPFACQTVVIRGVVIRNPVSGPNTDGIDPSCSQNVLIADCDIETGDDAICLKSDDAYGRPRISRNITVTNCVLSTCCNGFKIGTQTMGGFENITFSNSIIHSGNGPVNERVIAGLAIEMVDGGWIEGLVVSGIRMQNVRTPLFVRLGNRGLGQAEPVPGMLRGVSISDVHATGAVLTSSVTGLPDRHVEDVVLSNIRVETAEVGLREWVDREVPEVERDYPEARMFGRLPAYGVYLRHATGVRINGLTVRSTTADPRPVLVCDDVADLNLSNLDGTAPGPGVPFVDLRDTSDVSLRSSRAPRGTDVFVRVSGNRSRDVSLAGNDLSRASRAMERTALSDVGS